MKLSFIEEEENDFFISYEDFLSTVDNQKRTGRNNIAGRCQAHADKINSLSITRGAEGQAVVFCHAGCTYENIIIAHGFYKEPTKQRKQAKIVKTYDYKREDGSLSYQVVRLEPKGFFQRRPDGKGGWINNLDGIILLLYNLPLLIKNPDVPVFIVAGEKDADNLTERGFVATTNSGGEAKWQKDFNKYFDGRDVIIIQDNDKAGEQHSDLISKHIYRSATSVRILKLDGLKEKGDVSDWLEIDGNTTERLQELAYNAPVVEYTDEELDIDLSQSHDADAEQAVLGAILTNGILILKALEADLVKHIFVPKHRTILNAMIECFENKVDINRITVADTLGDKLETVGGKKFLRLLQEDLPKNFTIDGWIKIIVAKSQYRELVAVGKRLSTVASNQSASVDKIATSLIDRVFTIRSEEKREGFTRPEQHVDDIILKARNNTGVGISGIRTGFPDFDEATSGLQDSDLIVIAGRPSSGKTSLAMNIASHASIREGKNVGVFSLEMSKEQLITRMMCSESFVNAKNLRDGALEEGDWTRLVSKIPDVKNASLFIDDTPGLTINEIRAKCFKLQTELEAEGEKLDLLIIDYMQLMGGKGENRFQVMSEIARQLKALAKELNVPLIALSQLSRSVEHRTPPKPIMSDLRETGEIEQAADVVAFVYREEAYAPNEDNKGLAELILSKQRSGPTGSIYLAFINHFTKFMPLISVD